MSKNFSIENPSTTNDHDIKAKYIKKTSRESARKKDQD